MVFPPLDAVNAAAWETLGGSVTFSTKAEVPVTFPTCFNSSLVKVRKGVDRFAPIQKAFFVLFQVDGGHSAEGKQRISLHSQKSNSASFNCSKGVFFRQPTPRTRLRGRRYSVCSPKGSDRLLLMITLFLQILSPCSLIRKKVCVSPERKFSMGMSS